jgi:hypothetical protein
LRHRLGGQAAVLAVLAMTCMIGAVSLVIDAGIYFTLQRELQNAADAAVLDSVWYVPACFNLPAWLSAGCQPGAGPSGAGCPANDYPCTAAVEETMANAGVALTLCAGPVVTAGTVQAYPPPLPNIFQGIAVQAYPGIPPGNSLNVPKVNPYSVTLTCQAPHWFARIFPSVNLTMQVSASASAALGWLGQNGQLVGGSSPPQPTTPLVARLLT